MRGGGSSRSMMRYIREVEGGMNFLLKGVRRIVPCDASLPLPQRGRHFTRSSPFRSFGFLEPQNGGLLVCL